MSDDTRAGTRVASVSTGEVPLLPAPGASAVAAEPTMAGWGYLVNQLTARFAASGGKLPAKETLGFAAPLLVGLLIDVVDLLSFGPQGLVTGLLVGAPLAWWGASMWGASRGVRLTAAIAGMLYCLVPGTELLPLATLLQVITRFALALRQP